MRCAQLPARRLVAVGAGWVAEGWAAAAEQEGWAVVGDCKAWVEEGAGRGGGDEGRQHLPTDRSIRIFLDAAAAWQQSAPLQPPRTLRRGKGLVVAGACKNRVGGVVSSDSLVIHGS